MADSYFEREKAIFYATVADRAQRYDDLVEKMKEVAKMGEELRPEEMEYLSRGYWRLMKRRRDSLSNLQTTEQEERLAGNEENVARIIAYKKKVETEITDICKEALSLIDEHLIPSISTPTGFMHYHKMKGDFNRYLTEFYDGDERVEHGNEAIKAYEAAKSTASTNFPPSHPFRLSLELNIAVYHSVMLDSPQRAIEIAEQAVAEAKAEKIAILTLGEFQKTTRMLALLENNINMWRQDAV